jgi:hypothetical protein
MKITCIYCQRIWNTRQNDLLDKNNFNSVDPIFSFEFCNIKCIKNHIIELNRANPYHCYGCKRKMTSYCMRQFLDKYYDDSQKIDNKPVCCEECYKKVNKKHEQLNPYGFIKKVVNKFRISNV